MNIRDLEYLVALAEHKHFRRAADACHVSQPTLSGTRFEITDDFANKLKIDGYKIIGRYITGGNFKELRDGELQRIINHGFSYFPIFQDNGRKFSEFTYINGLEHGRKASEAALSKGIPPTVIYFAVDMDVYDYQIDSNIIPYPELFIA